MRDATRFYRSGPFFIYTTARPAFGSKLLPAEEPAVVYRYGFQYADYNPVVQPQALSSLEALGLIEQYMYRCIKNVV